MLGAVAGQVFPHQSHLRGDPLKKAGLWPWKKWGFRWEKYGNHRKNGKEVGFHHRKNGWFYHPKMGIKQEEMVDSPGKQKTTTQMTKMIKRGTKTAKKRTKIRICVHSELAETYGVPYPWNWQSTPQNFGPGRLGCHFWESPWYFASCMIYSTRATSGSLRVSLGQQLTQHMEISHNTCKSQLRRQRLVTLSSEESLHYEKSNHRIQYKRIWKCIVWLRLLGSYLPENFFRTTCKLLLWYFVISSCSLQRVMVLSAIRQGMKTRIRLDLP